MKNISSTLRVTWTETRTRSLMTCSMKTKKKQKLNQLARIFSGASSIINNVNVIYQSFLTLGDLLKSF